jgi:hypothetical protein
MLTDFINHVEIELCAACAADDESVDRRAAACMQESAFSVALVFMSGAQLCGPLGDAYGGVVGAPCEGQGREGVGPGLICVSGMFNLLGNWCLCRIYSPIV